MQQRTTRLYRGALAMLAVSGVLFAACGGGDSSSTNSDDTEQSDTDTAQTDDTKPPKKTTVADTEAPDTTEADTTVPETDPPTTQPEVQPITGQIDDIIIRETVDDLNTWWTSVFNQVYPDASYSPPTGGVWTMKSDTVVDCNGLAVTYDIVANNAKYIPKEACDGDVDLVIFDLEQLIPQLAADNGQFAPAFVAAHEWGHLIQARGNESNDKSINFERQADCFAGAWVAHVAQDGTPFTINTGDIDTALSALLFVGDSPGIDPNEDGAHGSAFDRVSAFNDGLVDIRTCATYQTSPPPVFESEFTTPEDAASGGNLDLITLSDLAQRDLNTFFTTEVDAAYPVPTNFVAEPCDGEVFALAYCEADGAIHYDLDRLTAIHETFGDFATVTLMARAYTDPLKIDRQVSNCVVGAFVHTLFVHASDNPATYNLSLSPGDLDEAVRVFLVESQDGDGIVSVDNLRSGVIQGLPACAALAGN